MGVQSDSKAVDEQAAYEKAFAALAAAAAGADFSDLFIGSTEAFNTYSPVQLVIDEQIAANALRFQQGIEVNDKTLSVESITKAGPMGNFLKQMETLMMFKKEHMPPVLSDRSNRQRWDSDGSKDTKKRAKDRMMELLNSHTPVPLETEVRKNIDNLIKEYSKSFGADALEKRSY
jgi:trimethylamine--corrinoid protein Co-methyltransferase